MAIKKRFKFTKTALEDITCPPSGREDKSGRVYVYDTLVPGLACCITESGARAFFWIGRDKGKPIRFGLGKYDALSVEQARAAAAGKNNDRAAGKGIMDARRTERAKAANVTTLGGLFDHWLEHHAKVHKKTWAQDKAIFDRYLKKWRDRDISAITHMDVQILHGEIGKDHGHYAANRCLAMISTLFNHAVTLGHERLNPAFKVKRFREQSRERFLSAEELPRFFKALEQEPNATNRDFFLMCLMTGARRGNVQQMKWAEIDLAGHTWRIPDTKAGRPQTVYLSAEAVRILTTRKDTAVGDYVFPGRNLDENRKPIGHLAEPKKAWAKLLERAEIDGLRIHDLRRTLGSWQAATGAGLPVIGRTLGHQNQSTTAIYARLDLSPVKAAVETATHAMMTAGDEKKKTKKKPAQLTAGTPAKDGQNG